MRVPFLLALLVVIATTTAVSAAVVEQIHLSLTKSSPYTIQVTCVHWEDSKPIIAYSPEPHQSLVKRASNSTELYKVSSWKGYISKYELNNLRPFVTYFYQFSDASGLTSEWFNFTMKSVAQPSPRNYPVVFGYVGDWGISNHGQETARAMAHEELDFVLVGGDLTYSSPGPFLPALQSINDQWYNLVQPIAANKPFMTAIGNHETYDNKAQPYIKRIGNSMPFEGPTATYHYSFDYSPFHIVALSSESEFRQGSDQYNFVARDLAAAAQSRIKTGFPRYIIACAHKSMYSSSSMHGSYYQFRDALQPLFAKYGVNLALWGHDHDYERTYPVDSRTSKVLSNVGSGTPSDPYRLPPSGTIHVTMGTGGADLRDSWIKTPEWSLIRTVFWGYSRLTTHENGTLLFEAVNNDGALQDTFTMVPTDYAEEGY